MNQLTRLAHRDSGVELRRLLPSADASAIGPHPNAGSPPRVFELDACFESAGVWAGVDHLAELAYLDLLQGQQDAILEEHQLELYMVSLKLREKIHPKYLCLTDTASAAEKTRFYALDRAYRLVHGLVGMVLQWKRTLHSGTRWVVVARNFDHAQHLAARFFAELARRSRPEDAIDVLIETRRDVVLTGLLAAPVPAALAPAPAAPLAVVRTKIAQLEAQVAGGNNILLERYYPLLLAHYRSSGDGLAAARIGLRIFIIYNSYGYYHEALAFMDTILPFFDQIVGSDEARRIYYVSKMNICLVMTDDPAGALRVVGELAESFLTRPHLIANMNYILGMHYLRYAEAKDVELAEHHILRAVEHVQAAKDGPDAQEYPFQKVFIDNGLAFLRARQGRHQEALDLCKAGYAILTSEMGEDRHVLHRSVLQYNIAQVYVMLGHLEDGIEYYRKAIDMDPNYSEYHNEIGNILQDQARYLEAIEHYRQAIKRSAPYPEVHFNKAVCHLRLAESEAALDDFQISLELNPAQPEAYALQADLLGELDKPNEALSSYDAAIALGYSATAVRVNRAVLHYNNGSYGLALADMDHVIAHDPSSADHYENRAAIHKAMNLDDLCLRDLETAARCRQAVSC